jgi:hypothetical protein
VTKKALLTNSLRVLKRRKMSNSFLGIYGKKAKSRTLYLLDINLMIACGKFTRTWRSAIACLDF